MIKTLTLGIAILSIVCSTVFQANFSSTYFVVYSYRLNDAAESTGISNTILEMEGSIDSGKDLEQIKLIIIKAHPDIQLVVITNIEKMPIE